MKNDIQILVVDDDEMMRTLLVRILEREGYKILTAIDGYDALAQIEKNEIDLVISDMKMPNMDGFELLKAIKQELPNTLVIIMTGYGDTYTVKDALLLGADEYITKPFKSHEISLIVERAYWRIVSSRKKEGEPAK